MIKKILPILSKMLIGIISLILFFILLAVVSKFMELESFFLIVCGVPIFLFASWMIGETVSNLIKIIISVVRRAKND